MPGSCLINDQLPITTVLPEVGDHLRHGTVVLEAPPGAGKSTQLPLWLLQQPNLINGLTILIQPRRVAAVSIANYLAQQLGEKPGQQIGYHVRGDRKATDKTRLLIVTDGIFTRMLQSDPELSGVGLLIFDEFHERNLHCDLGLALALEAMELRDDLKLMVMSATLPAQRLAQWLQQYQEKVFTVSSEGRAYPVEIHYSPPTNLNKWLDQVVAVMGDALEKAERGVLVFLPGQREIRYVSQRLKLPADIELFELSGGLTIAMQQAVLSPLKSGSGKRKVILATNIAETSLTIPDIDVVVDSGRERRAQFLPKYQFTRLNTRMIAQSSAIQRAGRAGRTSHGHCFRIWQESQWHSLAEYAPAAIEQEDLASLLLECAAWGTSPFDLAWFTPPSEYLVETALKKLEAIGAVVRSKKGVVVSALGKRLQSYGCAPEFAAMLDRSLLQVKGSAKNEQKRAAAMLSHATLLTAWNEEQECRDTGNLDELMQHVVAHPQKWPRTIRRWKHWNNRLAATVTDEIDRDLLAELILDACPWTLAQSKGHQHYRLATGVAAKWPQQTEQAHTQSTSNYIAVLSLGLNESKSEGVIQQAVDVTENTLWSINKHCSKQITAQWKGGSGTLIKVQEQRWWQLILKQSEMQGSVSQNERAEAFIRLIHEDKRGIATFLQSAQPLLNRIRLWHQLFGNESDWTDDALEYSLEEWALLYLSQLKSQSDLKRWNPEAALLARLGYETQRRLKQDLPTHWQAPSGRKHPIRYDYVPAKSDESADSEMKNTGSTALVSLKLQEVFGTPQSPRLAQDRLNLAFELLSPAGRPLHKTADLASFWTNAWPEVRKEMRGRYPKHPWPDDPLTAQATHLTKRALNNK